VIEDMWAHKMTALFRDTYAGVPMCKLAEDLRTYEHLLWEASPQVVIELGGFCGGSALWFRDHLRTLEAHGKVADTFVVTVELDVSRVRAHGGHLVPGSITDPAVAERVAAIVGDAPAMVVEDSAHTYETTYAALDNYARFVQPGGFFVVEDTFVDDDQLRLDGAWPRGVNRAIHDWLPGQPFKVRDDFGRYGYTTNRGGLLQHE
jgi:cephalosporin hydroxylase